MNRKNNLKNIFFISYSSMIGGNITYIDEVSKYLSKKGFKVTILLFGDNLKQINTSARVIHVGKNERILKSHSNLFKLYQAFKKLERKSITPDLVIIDIHRYVAYFQIVKQFLPYLKKAPFFYQFHGFDVLQRNFSLQKKPLPLVEKIKFEIEKRLIKQAKKVFCFSSYSKKLLKQYISFKKGQLIKTNPGKGSVKLLKGSKEYYKSKLSLPKNKNIILLIGRFETRKGIRFFLKNIPSSLLKNSCIAIASDFNDPELQNISFPNDATFTIFNNPNIVTKSQLYKAADCTVLPSLDLETFGFVTQESLLLGTPVIAYDIGANHELIPNKFLVPIEKPLKIYKKINWFFKNKKKLQKEVESLSNQISKEYSWKRYFSKMLKNNN